MAAKAQYLQEVILKCVFQGDALPDFSDANDIYLALYNTAGVVGTDTPPSSEVSGGSYARVAIKAKFPTLGSGLTTDSSGTALSTNAEIAFPVATADWGAIQGMAIMSASSGGNMLYWANFSPVKTIYNGDQLKIASGSLTIKED